VAHVAAFDELPGAGAVVGPHVHHAGVVTRQGAIDGMQGLRRRAGLDRPWLHSRPRLAGVCGLDSYFHPKAELPSRWNRPAPKGTNMNHSSDSLPIYVTNKSTRVSDANVKTMTEAVATQVRDHFAPAWQIPANPVSYLSGSDQAPATGAILTVVDTPDQDGVLGWHTEGDQGVIYGYVFAAPVLNNGGQVLSAARYTVAATLSHEVLETIVDPHVNLWATGPAGWVISQEVCDPVENSSYTINGVSVSNFVTPAWFDAHASPRTPMDHLGKVSKPFQVDRGGYFVHFKGGNPSQVFGDDVPDWRRTTKTHVHSRAGHLATLQPLKRLR
jgi:hypothetical protein